MENTVRTRAAGESKTGPVRRANEDGYAVSEPLGLVVVADGMGGHAAGEVASRLAIDTVTAFIARSSDNPEFSWPYGIVPSLSYNGNRLRTAVYLANRKVFRTAEAQDEYLGMGTTVVAVLIASGRLVVAHVGDSRAYLLRGGELRLLTRDDSWLATVLAADPTADASAFATHPMRNVLTNALGSREDVDVHIQEHDIGPGDAVVLTTDGVHGVIETAGLLAVLAQSADPETAAAGLVSAALAAGSRDNATAVVAMCDAGSPR